MNAYEFTRVENGFTHKMDTSDVNVPWIAHHVVASFARAGQDYTEDPDYIEARHIFIDTTMSCNQLEAVKWLEYYMVNAIAYGIATKNLDWKTKFLAAYDLWKPMPSYLKEV